MRAHLYSLLSVETYDQFLGRKSPTIQQPWHEHICHTTGTHCKGAAHTAGITLQRSSITREVHFHKAFMLPTLQ